MQHWRCGLVTPYHLTMLSRNNDAYFIDAPSGKTAFHEGEAALVFAPSMGDKANALWCGSPASPGLENRNRRLMAGDDHCCGEKPCAGLQ
ncbi:hypothetical protein [Acidithiobacillus ferrivorans]|nr:hypothetical protein [Acidithiobacillus ferrivorans]